MEGSLKKKNSAGVWKDRFCHLQNVYMITYKPKEKDGKIGPSGMAVIIFDSKREAHYGEFKTLYN